LTIKVLVALASKSKGDMVKSLSKRGFATVVLLAIITMFGGITAYADDFVIDPFRIVSEDGSRVFIYTPNPYFRWERDSILPETGVYYATEPLELIYLLEGTGWAFERDFVFSQDFRHLAFFVGMSFDIALEFYEDGVLIKRCMIDDLVENMDEVSVTTSRAWWEEWSGRSFDSANNTLTVTTVDNLTYVFDITTGDIVESNRANEFQYFIVVVGIVIVVCGVALLIMRYRKK